MSNEQLAQAIYAAFSTVDSDAGERNVVSALEGISAALGYAGRHLGTGNATTEMGALELVGKEIHDGSEAIAGGLHAVAEAISELAEAVRHEHDD